MWSISTLVPATGSLQNYTVTGALGRRQSTFGHAYRTTRECTLDCTHHVHVDLHVHGQNGWSTVRSGGHGTLASSNQVQGPGSVLPSSMLASSAPDFRRLRKYNVDLTHTYMSVKIDVNCTSVRLGSYYNVLISNKIFY